MNSEIDYPWIFEISIYAIHRTVHYSWIGKNCDFAQYMNSTKLMSTLHG